MKTSRSAIGLFAAALLLLIACDSGGADSATETPTASAGAQQTAASAPAAVSTTPPAATRRAAGTATRGLTATPAPVAKELQTLRDDLVAEGIVPTSLTLDGGELSIELEASQAAEYDAHLLVVWALVFGFGADYAQETISIVNTVDGEPVLLVMASVEDVRLLALGVYTADQFFSRLNILTLNKDGSVAE